MIQRPAVVLSESAISDLEAIGAYILESSGSENIANGFVDRIEERCQSIGNAPRGGRSRDDIVRGLRPVPFRAFRRHHHLIENDVIRIVNIFYGGRDYETRMRDGGSNEPS
ncbi:type II toxin-antitoxin system RelE/ParE family toxin [Mesorhizobium sp. WSM1293]|uniref:type II toxin-antitoxin system RelE/ParE family toxin n=1 Tax=Mesorhizobium sp. WSM1293 TaxID=1040984 RepID=UPI0004890522|nr:type II toxin-antitoxin system RelE/ParE family toxin [Mesorhizobium sp. WSM1293]